MERLRVDVAIIGGGPAGSTVGTLLKRYRPDLEVAIFEKERFPRDHVGESQLPAITWVLDEMGVWDKVEAAGFPIKLGAAYRWGATDELWHLDFIDPESYEAVPRPAPLSLQRRRTAFQVDRSVYDTILLDHAESVGCRVFRETPINEVKAADGFVTGLVADSFEVKAKRYVDASAEAGILRKAVGVEAEYPTSLRNVAFWDYWQETGWAERVGDAATRIHVMSLGWGWMWFIPISDSRTSVGLVVPASHYKGLGLRPEELYLEAIASEPHIRELTRSAKREMRFRTTRDWNFLSERLAGQNWFLTGDTCGFADPILSAGMTLAHTSGRKVAYSILEQLASPQDVQKQEWIRQQYSEVHRHQIRHHMRFAEFWYAGNGRFTALKEFCSELAASSGLKLDADAAFFWLSTGGFAQDTLGVPVAATFPMAGVKQIATQMTGQAAGSLLEGKNVIVRNVDGAEETTFANYRNGRVLPVPCLVRGDRRLPVDGAFDLLLNGMAEPAEIDRLIHATLKTPRATASLMVDSLEALVAEGWAVASYDPSLPPSKAVVLGSKVGR